MAGADLKILQDLINDVFPGIAIFVRDVNLQPACAVKYTQGLIVHERGFTDASCRVGGLFTTHRFAILSNHIGNISMFEHGTNWGLCMAKSGAHFKVLDVYEYQGKTQITLLHLPDDERWKLFINTEISIEKGLVDECRSRFREKCSEEPIPELCTEEWLKRCSFPLGMDENGILFDL